MMLLRRALLLLSPLVAATSATGPGGMPPWWVIHKVKPEGAPKNHGSWTSVTFSEEQQARFAVDEDGKAADEEGFQAALRAFDSEGAVAQGQPSSRRLNILPPWWVLHMVKPEGEKKDMGGWTAITFSKEQQAKFGVDEDGKVVDEEKFNMALQAVDEKAGPPESRRLMLPPWWVLHKVKPQGEVKDMGGWTAVTFSKEQQAKFAVDEDGEVVDQEAFTMALQAADVESGAAQGQHNSRRLMLPPWWVLHKVKPQGEVKDMGDWTAATFSKEQQAKFAVDEDGEVVDQERFHVALQAVDEETTPEMDDLMPPLARRLTLYV